ncbi:MAG: hypothetical protein AAGF20_13995 [Pseudomonadota bacterium]
MVLTKLIKPTVLACAMLAAAPSVMAEHLPPYDILGLTTGIPLEEAHSTLIEQGWRVKNENAFVIRGTDIEYVQDRTYEKGAETMHIEYTLPPTQQSLMKISRSTPVGGSGALVTLDTLQSGLVQRYGPYQHEHMRSAGGRLQWFDGADAERCATTGSPNAFLVRHHGGTAAVSNCDGYFLSVQIWAQTRNIGPVVSRMTQTLVDVYELPENYLRFERYAAEEIAAAERRQTEGAELPPL